MLDTSQLPRDVELSRWNPTPIDQPCACKSQGQSKDCTSETETSPFFQTLSPIPRTQATTEDATTENLTQEAVHDNQPAHAHGSKYIPVFDETEPSLEEQLPEINKPDLEGLLPPDTFALDSEDDLNLHDPMAQHFRSPPDFDIEVLLDILEAGEASNEGSHRTESSSSVDESNFQDGLPTFEDHVRRDCLGLFGSLIPAL
ncbi:uncharacterized protein FIESC28_05388 [Fusarium coffeatum]|uniref:Uncharacterized protein n=1 Tax=Fusarium coffeatum TaxID=231269 RepID=A0A366RSN4_9HYPO|nr:uncharacterized protein FIESC28_05388 [Fusarium coffeatum]RBR20109.1 hypothetical protein FIESC28_05388 [Fusarium coffeatum]